MHLFAIRKKTALLLTTSALIALVAASFIAVFSIGTASAASRGALKANIYHGTAGHISLLSTTKPSNATHPVPTPGTPPATGLGTPHTFAHLSLKGAHTAAAARSNGGQPAAGSLTMNTKEGQLLHNFNGLSNQDQAVANGGPNFAVTPPDQGLCIGADPAAAGQTAVFEPINSAIAETSTNGGSLSGNPLLGNTVLSFGQFWEPNAFSDPRCFYDQATKTFFFTVIGFMLSGPDAGQTSIDVAVYNAHGFAVYQVDSSFGGQFFGDQPHVGYDNNNLYLTTDAFNVAGTAYFGATLFALSKSQLVAEASSIAEDVFGPLSLGGIPILTLEPAIGTTPSNTEYLLNSFPFADGLITPNAVSKQLGFWTVSDGGDLSKGHPEKVTLSGHIITSELYAFPVNAVSTGDGQVTNQFILSEPALNADDDRLLQVQFINGHLWAALTTAVSIDKDPVVRDGVAWFNIDAKAGKVSSQGYIASQGNYLIYPAILHSAEGTTAITFTVTSATTNPSAAYVVRKADSGHFGSIQIAGAGTGAHLSFSDVLFNEARWGDYSAAAFAPNGKDIWLSTEYIPPVANQNVFDNWGTRVFEVKGEH